MASESAGSGATAWDLAARRDPWAAIEIRGLGKQFAGEIALQDVDIDIARGEVHGLVGANGAGKSTLIRCLAGVTVPDQGKILIGGEELRQGSPQASEKAGLAFIHQELNLVLHFSALQNMLLGAPKATRLGLIDWKRSSVGAKAAAQRVGIRFPLDTIVSELSVAERWLVMIGKALAREASMIAMDEPTAALSAAESEQLFAIVRDLAADGVAILYVSHRLDEVLGLCDRITVFRDGRVVERAERGSLDKKGLIRAIVGHDVKGSEARRKRHGGPKRRAALPRPVRWRAPPHGEVRQLRSLPRRNPGAWWTRRLRPDRSRAPGVWRRPPARRPFRNGRQAAGAGERDGRREGRHRARSRRAQVAGLTVLDHSVSFNINIARR